MENEIDLNVLGNSIKNEKMRKAFFIFCADVATYIADSHEQNEEESGDIDGYAEILVRESTDLQKEIKEKWSKDDFMTHPFDIGHLMVHIVAKQFEEDPQEGDKKIKFFNWIVADKKLKSK